MFEEIHSFIKKKKNKGHFKDYYFANYLIHQFIFNSPTFFYHQKIFLSSKFHLKDFFITNSLGDNWNVPNGTLCIYKYMNIYIYNILCIYKYMNICIYKYTNGNFCLCILRLCILIMYYLHESIVINFENFCEKLHIGYF